MTWPRNPTEQRPNWHHGEVLIVAQGLEDDPHMDEVLGLQGLVLEKMRISFM
jgi:hypothetical protein